MDRRSPRFDSEPFDCDYFDCEGIAFVLRGRRRRRGDDLDYELARLPRGPHYKGGC